MKSLINCPFCDGIAALHHERRPINYRSESFNVAQAFYKCDSCEETFTTTESDTFSINQLHAHYRAQHRIPFPEELFTIRTKYGLSAKRMSQLLGLGDNTYGLYEKGDMPTLANANLIKISAKPASFYSMVEGMITDKEIQMINRAHTKNVSAPLFNIYTDADEMTGFRRPDFNRTTQVLSYFLSKSEPKFNSPLKLNKILYYADFTCFRELGRSMMGLSYRAAPYGPVPSRYDTLYAELKNLDFLNATAVVSAGGNVFEIFQSPILPDMSIFSIEEIAILDKVVHTFADTTPERIMNISHDEKAWIERNPKKELISYPEYAFNLVAI